MLVRFEKWRVSDPHGLDRAFGVIFARNGGNPGVGVGYSGGEWTDVFI